MTAGHEGDSFMHGEFQPEHEAYVVQSSPLQKYGEAILKAAATEEEMPQTQSTEPFSSARDSYVHWNVSQISSALERTDLSNPKQPFFDF